MKPDLLLGKGKSKVTVFVEIARG
jgi:hypothetical protein